MADILIWGMEMPETCDECPMYTCMHNRADCPLVELPEHGDLIDRGEIVAHYRKCECNLGSDRHLEFLTVHDWIEEGIVYDLLNAPVVIPSNKEGSE